MTQSKVIYQHRPVRSRDLMIFRGMPFCISMYCTLVNADMHLRNESDGINVGSVHITSNGVVTGTVLGADLGAVQAQVCSWMYMLKDETKFYMVAVGGLCADALLFAGLMYESLNGKFVRII
eukprot:g16388.t1